ncbi:hypothetical protein BP6252_14159 [Coleophoma cylindrospora]|uniref:Heterokaryon incompatibility domain-containing protein n=1 Tax=Coleophoma cylindrospora TaxID=1849047 RepID=A0A3D8Q4S9_9HELO|nr:hypothetical protein BP6252_14159 [Coleophoma cylindrospora]
MTSASRIWSPGYWETAGEDGRHGPPPQQLESPHIQPTRCALWMKLRLFLRGQVPSSKSDLEPLIALDITVEEGWAIGRDAFHTFAVLMQASCKELSDTIHPPTFDATIVREPRPASSFSAEECRQFNLSLSDCQRQSWKLLKDWWNGEYQDATLSSAARTFIKEAPRLPIDYLKHQNSVYQEALFSLWDAEFNPAGWTTGSSRGQDGNRRMAFEHAMAQKAGILVLSELQATDATGLLQDCSRSLPACIDNCPWLSKEVSDNRNADCLPLYLWDTFERRTKKVEDLLKLDPHPITYTCISHTWGRRKKDPLSLVEVLGVDKWKIPENTLFDVKELPTILLEARLESRFVWFDLLCLPQDPNSPEYLSEVSRQATIFHHASSCIAWINTISSWHNLDAAVRWLCLHFMYAGSHGDIYDVESNLAAAAENARACNELIVNSSEFALWLSSTWTLQESCLCPDIIFCNKTWERLEVVKGTPIGLYQLLTLYSINREAYLVQPTEFRDWPLSAGQLAFVQTMVSGTDVQISRVGILGLGATRECEKRRADAIMSAMGVTDWYVDHLQRYGEAPPDRDLVLGSYPLAFVNEAVSKIGSEFFSSYGLDVLKLPAEDVRGSLLPFGPPGYHLLSGSGLHPDWYGDTVDHPSLKTWTINVDGSVSIPKATVLLDSEKDCNRPIKALVNIALQGGGTDILSCDLQECLQNGPPATSRLAVVLAKIRDTLTGIILQSVSLQDSERVCWVRIGNWETTDVQEFPLFERTNIRVL